MTKKNLKRINIFGSSEKLLELGDEGIKKLLSPKTPSIGINHFPIHYPDVDYWIFSDGSTIEKIEQNNAYKGQKILTNEHIYKNYFKNKKNWEIADTFEPNGIAGHIANSGWFALWWAVKQGYKSAYLYGVMDGDNYKQMANGNTEYNNIFDKKHIFQNKGYEKFKKVIETGFNGRIKIYQPLLKSLDVQTESES